MNFGRAVFGGLGVLFCCISWATEPLYIKYGAYLHPPWVIETAEGLKGITPEYVQEVERRSKGLRIELDLQPFRRAIVQLKEGKVDMVASIDRPALRAFAEPIVPFGKLQMTLFTKKPYLIKTLADLGEFKLGILRGMYVEYLFEDYPNIELIYVNSESSGFSSVDKGYLDGVVFAEVAYRYYSESQGWPYSHLRQTMFLGAIPVYGWTNRGRAQEASFQELQRIVDIMEKDGSGHSYMSGVGVDFGFNDMEGGN